MRLRSLRSWLICQLLIIFSLIWLTNATIGDNCMEMEIVVMKCVLLIKICVHAQLVTTIVMATLLVLLMRIWILQIDNRRTSVHASH